MALWGTKDTVYSTGKVNADVTTGVVTRQSGAIAWTGVAVGDVITIADDGAGVGEGVILSIDDTGPGAGAQITISTQGLPDTNFTNVDYEIRQKPKYTLHDTNYDTGEIFGVDTTEQSVARAASSQYAPAHAGWVGITSYTQTRADGTTVTRVKTEVLVAGSSITGGANDDTDDQQLPDS